MAVAQGQPDILTQGPTSKEMPVFGLFLLPHSLSPLLFL